MPFWIKVAQQLPFDEEFEEAMHVGMFGEERLVEPTGLVILTVSFVVTVLGAPHFVAHQNHGRTEREHGDGKKVLYLPVSQHLHGGIVRGPSTPQFQLRLSSEPSLFSSPFASLCLWL